MSELKGTEWLHHLYMQAPVAIGIYIGERHIIELANPRMCEIWGRTPDQVLNRPLFEALPEVARQGFEEILQEVLQTGKPFSGNELPATLRRNGKLELCYFNIVYDPLRNAEGNIYGIVQTAVEVTEQVEARKKAERNEEILKVALEGGKMGTWYLDFVQGTFLRSVEHDRIFGYPELQEDFSREQLLQHIHPDDRAFVREKYQQAMQQGFIDYEARIFRNNDSLHWIHIKGKTYYNLKGQPVSLSGIIMDITRRKEITEGERQQAMEQAAREEAMRQGKMLHDLFMHAPALICTLTGPRFTFELVNPAYQQLFPERQLLDKDILDALPELKGQPIMDILRGVYQTGETFIGNEVPVQLNRSSTGELQTAYFNFVYQAMHDAEENTTGIVVFAFEVTEQILARKKVEESEASLRLALEAGSMGTWSLDLLHDTSIRSLQHDQIFGYDTLLPAWGYEKFLQHVLPEDRPKVKAAFEKSAQTGHLLFETRIRRADQQIRWITAKGQTFYEDGKPASMAGVVADVTERKLAEEKLQHLTQELAASNEELTAANEEIQAHLEDLSQANRQLMLINADLDNFIYTASHDLKAPIANIEGLVLSLARHLNTPNLNPALSGKYIELMQASIERFKSTIRDLTDIVRLQKEDEEITMVNPSQMIQEVQMDLQPAILQSQAKINTEVAECPRIPFSRKNFKSIIYNLLSNAIKYHAPDRSPVVSVFCFQEAAYFVLAVQDNGLGISKAGQAKIFQMFKRLHTHVEGSGVGLYLVKRIVDNAGGRMEVESEEGKGSTFRVYLPAAAVQE